MIEHLREWIEKSRGGEMGWLKLIIFASPGKDALQDREKGWRQGKPSDQRLLPFSICWIYILSQN